MVANRVSDWVSPWGDAAPRAEGEARFDLACRTVPRGPGVPHRLRIDAEWEVTAPHDLEAERVVVAMGGHLTCIELVDTVLPALRRIIQLRHRRVLPAIAPSEGWNRWRLCEPVERCECVGDFDSAERAAEHERDVDHWARAVGPSAELLGEIAQTVGLPQPQWSAPAQRISRLIREPDGLRELWLRGIPPEYAEFAHVTISLGGAPLPRVAVEALAFGVASVETLRSVAVNGSEDHDWRRALEIEPRPATRAKTFSSASGLERTSYSLDEAERIAGLSGGSVSEAVRLLRGWASIGCQPDLDDLEVLIRSPDLGRAPSLGEAQFAFARAQLWDPQVHYDVVVVLLALAGSGPEMMRLLRRGIRSLPDAVTAIDEKGD